MVNAKAKMRTTFLIALVLTILSLFPFFSAYGTLTAPDLVKVQVYDYYLKYTYSDLPACRSPLWDLVCDMGSKVFLMYIDTDCYIRIYVIDKATETIVRTTYITDMRYAMGTPYKINNSVVIIPMQKSVSNSGNQYHGFMWYNIDTGAYGSAYTASTYANVAQTSNVIKSLYDNNYYVIWHSRVGRFLLGKYVLSTNTFTIANDYSSSGYGTNSPIRLIYNGSASTTTVYCIYATSSATQCNAGIMRYEIGASVTRTGPFTSPLSSDWSNTLKYAFISERTYTVSGDVYYFLQYAYHISDSIIIKSLRILKTDDTNSVYGYTFNQYPYSIITIGGKDGDINNVLCLYHVTQAEGIYDTYSLKIPLTGRPLNPEFGTPTYYALYEAPYYTTNLLYTYKYLDTWRFDLDAVDAGYDSNIAFKTKDIYAGEYVYTIDYTYIPYDNPLRTYTQYAFTVTGLRNDKVFKSMLIVYVDNAQYKVLDLSQYGYSTFTYSTTYAGIHNFTFVLRDVDLNVNGLTVTVMFNFVAGAEPDTTEVPVIIALWVSILTQIFPLLFLLIFPALLFAKYVENKTVGILIGLTVGIFFGIAAGLIPTYVVYMFILVIAMGFIYMVKR